MNSQNLAPPITKENAAEYARRATISRERNRAERKAQILASPDLHARKEVEREINRILAWMRKAKSREEHAKLARTLDSLWTKVYSDVSSAKPSKPRPVPVAPVQPTTPAL